MHGAYPMKPNQTQFIINSYYGVVTLFDRKLNEMEYHIDSNDIALLLAQFTDGQVPADILKVEAALKSGLVEGIINSDLTVTKADKPIVRRFIDFNLNVATETTPANWAIEYKIDGNDTPRYYYTGTYDECMQKIQEVWGLDVVKSIS